MKNVWYCPSTIIDQDIICEHKLNRITMSSLTVTPHNHDGYEIIIFLGGNASVIVESLVKEMERGDIVFVSPYSFHGMNLTGVTDYERITINIKLKYLQEICDDETDLSVCFRQMLSGRFNLIHLDEPTLQQFVTLADRLEKCIASKQFGWRLLSRALLTEFMITAAQYMDLSSSPHYESLMPNIVYNVIEYIEQNITGDLTVNSIAKHFHHNSDYLSKVFKNATGNSLKYFINAKRITLAQQYLQQGYSPYDVCFMVGYNNYSSFSRCFSNYIGCPPKQYQLQYQGDYGRKLLGFLTGPEGICC